jgi:hypothetical protein
MKFSEWFYWRCAFYSYSLLRGVTFDVLPLSSYALSPTMLPLLETFWELLLWYSFQCRCHTSGIPSKSWNLRPFRADFISGKSQKSLGAKWGEQGGCYISVIDFWARNCLTESALWAGALSWWRIQSLDQSSGLYLPTASRNRFSISTQ